MFQPAVLNPEPEPWFVKELSLIDPDLRVVFGYDRYLMHNWVIEGFVHPPVYAKRYFSFLTSGEPRFIDQPIYDHAQPIVNDEGEELGFKVVGHRKFDMAPDWEWRKTIQHPDGSYKPLGMDDILALKREYAWNRNHAYSRAKFEAEEAEKQAKLEAAKKEKRMNLWLESYDEALLEAGQRVTTGAR